MKYIFVNDLYSFFKKYKKYLIIYYMILLIYIGIKYISKCEFDTELLLIIFGFINPKNFSVLDITIFVLNYSFNIFIVFQLFDNDIKNGFCNIFLRIKKMKWLLLKIVSCILFMIIKIFIIFIFSIFIFKINYLRLFIYLLIGILCVTSTNIFITIFMTYHTKFKSLMIIIYSLLILLNIIPFNVIDLINYWFLILIVLVIQILILYYRKSKIYIMLEEGDFK